jgi:hypothetical protein
MADGLPDGLLDGRPDGRPDDLPQLHAYAPSWQGRPAGRLRAAAALSTGLLVSGCRAGELQLWSDSQLLRRTQAHEGAVRALTTAPDGQRFASGGDDGAVLLWHKDATRLRRIDLAAALGTLLDPLGRPLTAAGAALPAVRELVYLGLISRVSRAISPL